MSSLRAACPSSGEVASGRRQRPIARDGPLRDVVALQRAAGNAAVSSLIRLAQRQVGADPDLHKPIPNGTDSPEPACLPHTTKAKAIKHRDELLFWAVPMLGSLVDDAVVPIWEQYLRGGSPPKEITDPAIIEAFRRHPVTQAARDTVIAETFKALEEKPEIEDGTHPMEELFPGDRFEKLFKWSNDPLSIPGNLAGGLDPDQLSKPMGALPSPYNDSRRVRGTVVVETLGQLGRIATVKPVVSVDDTVDLCPGNIGGFFAKHVTLPFSKCEASGVSGDVPFHLSFPLDPLTRKIPAKPAPPVPPTPISLPTEHLFAFDSAELTPAGEQELADKLGDRPGRADVSRGVTVVGHTDSKGSDAYNLGLSRARAARIGRFLAERYPNLKGHVQTDGRGEREPVAPNEVDGRDNPEGRRVNRRVVIEMAAVPAP